MLAVVTSQPVLLAFFCRRVSTRLSNVPGVVAEP